MIQTEIQYPNEVEVNAVTFGFKAANSMYLKKLLNEIQSEAELTHTGTKVIVPAFMPISAQLIEEHLDKYATKEKGWRQFFEAFKHAYHAQTDKETLEPSTLMALEELQKCINRCFKQYLFSNEQLSKFLGNTLTEQVDALLFMARSSGMNEDKADMPNPGGNESIVTTATRISQALGVVAASYVSEKSLLQRLKAGDRSITEVPVMPVLVQVLVGEALNQQAQQVVSGVMYTNGGAVRIQSALGHGEYVVNSKGPTDNYYISLEGIVYTEIRAKSNRLKPKLNTMGNKVVLVWEENTSQDEYASSLPPEVLRVMQLVSNKIETSYKMRMDIEFVYEPKNKTLNIVQARAIPAGDRKNLEPSAVSPRYLASPTQTLQTVTGLQVITPEVNIAAVITDRSQVIICKDIKDALEEYLKSAHRGRDIRAVIVENYSPDTSHEAGQFNLKAIPVMRVADLSVVEVMLNAPDLLLIVDSQHSKIYQMNVSLKNSQNDVNTIAQSLYQNGILEKGIFASTLSAHIIPQNYNLNPRKELEELEELKSKHIEYALKTFNESQAKLGELVNLAERGDSNALDLLLSVAYEAMRYPPETTQEKVAGKTLRQKLQYNLEQLETPKIGEDNDACKKALGYTLRALSNAHKKGHISNKVYKQTIISGSELAVLLDRMQNPNFRQQDRSSQDAIFLEYFNVKKKFEAGIMSTNTKSVLTQSVLTDIVDERHKKNIQIKAMGLGIDLSDFNKRQKLCLYEVSKLSGGVWQKFCLEVCKTIEGANQLAYVVTNLSKLNIHKNWLNIFFMKAYKKHNEDSTKTFDALMNEFKDLNFHSIKESQQLMAELEAQIQDWANPIKFDNLYKRFEENLAKLAKILNYNNDCSNLEKYVILQSTKQRIDIIDRTIKSLAYSRLYQNNEHDHKLRAERFRKLMIQFFNCMKPWLANAYPYETNQMNSLIDKFEQAMQMTAYDQNTISVSDGFDVRETIIMDTKSGHARGAANLKKCKTLEDWFSCIHQNFVAAVDEVEKQQGLIIGREFYPLVMAQFEEAFMTLKGKMIGNHTTPISNPLNHLDQRPPHIIYSIPLSVHNAMVTVFQSPKTGVVQLQYVTGSSMAEESHRWREIQLKLNFDLVCSGIKIEKGYKFEHEPNYLHLSHFCVQLSTDNIPTILKTIELAIAGTYQSSYSEHKPEDEARFLLLEKMDEKELEKIHGEALSLIKNGYFKISYFFNNNTVERIKILHKLINLEEPSVSDLRFFDLEESEESEESEKSDEEILKNHKFRTIQNLLDDAHPDGIKSFFIQLDSNLDFNDTFCCELTGYGKTEFAKRFMSTARFENGRKDIIIPEILSILKNSNSEDLREIQRKTANAENSKKKKRKFS
jgi:hypothetical protein